MKNLHRKISAILLAGMVVVGGVAASGASSFAADKVYSPAVKSQIQRVEFYVKRGPFGGEVLSVRSSEKELNKDLEKYSNENINIQKKIIKVGNLDQLLLQVLSKSFYRGKVVKVELNRMYYLIRID